MDLMHNCMREALRLHPPLVLLMRKVLKDIKVNVASRSLPCQWKVQRCFRQGVEGMERDAR